MINVLKRLAELDSGNPNVENRMTVDTPLATVSNVYEDTNSVEECGDMPAPSAAPHSAANISVTANSGDEVASMLKSLMALSGLSNTSSMPSHKEIEVSSPHAAEPVGDMASVLSMVDKMDGPSDKIDIVGDDLAADEETDEGFKDTIKKTGMAAALGATALAAGGMAKGAYDYHKTDPATGMSRADMDNMVGNNYSNRKSYFGSNNEGGMEEESWDNSPEQEIEPHDYGDKQVKPKQQGFAQRIGDNPYKMAHESINNLSSQLLKEYEAFKNAQ